MVRVNEWKKSGRKGWEVDIRVTMPDGTRVRERLKSPVTSKSGTLRWAQAREAELLARGGRETEKPKEVPTLGEFWPRFLEGYAEANKEKPNQLATRRRIWSKHLEPAFGATRLDAITDEEVQRFKGQLGKGLSAKSVNNVLTNLRKCLNVAVEWGVLPSMPCRIRQVKASKPIVEFYEEEEFERLLSAAEDPRARVAVLLGGDAGLRLGEVLGLEWKDIDSPRSQLKVQRAISDDGTATVPKSGKPRVVPMTDRLREALAKLPRHLRAERVLCDDEGNPLDKWALKWMVDVAERRASLRPGGRVHILRHTFCSRLAARGVPLLTIKELAGHSAVETTMRYMHLSASAPREAIRALQARGELGEKRAEEKERPSNSA